MNVFESDQETDEYDENIHNIYYCEILCQNKEFEKALDFIYDYIDELIIDRNYEAVNKILESIDPSSINSKLIIAILTITKGCQKKLKGMDAFHKKSIQTLKDRNEYNQNRNSKTIEILSDIYL